MGKTGEKQSREHVTCRAAFTPSFLLQKLSSRWGCSTGCVLGIVQSKHGRNNRGFIIGSFTCGKTGEGNTGSNLFCTRHRPLAYADTEQWLA